MAVIYLNGRFEKEEAACLSPFNRGLLYGDGIFETMRGYKGQVFALEEHFNRLKNSADFLKIPVPFSLEALETILVCLIEKNGLTSKESRIRVNLIRGEGRRGLLPDEEAESEVIITVEAVSFGIKKIQQEGVRLVIIRGHRLDHRSPLAHHKTFNYIPGIMGLLEVKKKGGDEGLFLNYDDNIAEGVTSNLFMVKNGKIITPPLLAGLLPGITRKTVIAAAAQGGVSVEERDIPEGELSHADELFITSSVREVVPVLSLDGKQFEIGPVTRQIQAIYRRYVEESFG